MPTQRSTWTRASKRFPAYKCKYVANKLKFKPHVRPFHHTTTPAICQFLCSKILHNSHIPRNFLCKRYLSNLSVRHFKLDQCGSLPRTLFKCKYPNPFWHPFHFIFSSRTSMNDAFSFYTSNQYSQINRYQISEDRETVKFLNFLTTYGMKFDIWHFCGESGKWEKVIQVGHYSPDRVEKVWMVLRYFVSLRLPYVRGLAVFCWQKLFLQYLLVSLLLFGTSVCLRFMFSSRWSSNFLFYF